jgi:hypothetical protein
MRKDASGVSEYCRHTRKGTGLRRLVNKRNRKGLRAELQQTVNELAMAEQNNERLRLKESHRLAFDYKGEFAN